MEGTARPQIGHGRPKTLSLLLPTVHSAGSYSFGLWFAATGTVPHQDGQINTYVGSIPPG